MTQFYLDPHRSKAHVIIVYRNFMAAENPQCHIGLGVGALHTVRVLRKHHVDARAYGVWTADHIQEHLRRHPETTHCVIEAPWVPLADTQRLLGEFPDVHFLVRSHSQIGFLQVEAGAITLLRELLLLQDGVLNLTVAANSHRLKNFVERTYSGACLYLPNLYDVERPGRKRDVCHEHRSLRIGSFGALRLLKNHTSAAAAALMIARARGCDLEFSVSIEREENGRGVLDALRAMFANVPWARLVEQPWMDWSQFRRVVETMDLCIQVSHTETFNFVTADAAAAGVPSVVSPMIEWPPAYWQVDPDAIEDMARVGSALLSSTEGADDGLRALEHYVRGATHRWLSYLDRQPGGLVQN